MFFCEVNEDDKYCSLCGAKLLENCPKCEYPITNPYAVFCKNCGSDYPHRKTDSKTNRII